MPSNSPYTKGLVQRAIDLERRLANEPVAREEVLDLIEAGLRAISVDTAEVHMKMHSSSTPVRRRTGVALVEAATAVQKGVSLLSRIDSQTVKPFARLAGTVVSADDFSSLINDDEISAIDPNDDDVHQAQNAAALAAAEEWVQTAWGRLWIQMLVAWTNGYGHSGSKPWLDFLDEAYNIGDETPKSRSWLRRKFDEVYERCVQQPDLKKLLLGNAGRLPERPGRGRKTINLYAKRDVQQVKIWRCTGEKPQGACDFAITPKIAKQEGLLFPQEASEDDYRRCPESVYCGGLCRPQFA